MSIVVTYVCDRCGHSQATDQQMWHVGVKVALHGYGTPRAKFGPYETGGMLLWCRPCVDKLQLLGFPVEAKKLPVEEQPALVTLEDKIREIVRNELECGNG